MPPTTRKNDNISNELARLAPSALTTNNVAANRIGTSYPKLSATRPMKSAPIAAPTSADETASPSVAGSALKWVPIAPTAPLITDNCAVVAKE
jgi:hypothetical protein